MIDRDGRDWIRNLETDEYEWNDNVKSREDTPQVMSILEHSIAIFYMT